MRALTVPEDLPFSNQIMEDFITFSEFIPFLV